MVQSGGNALPSENVITAQVIADALEGAVKRQPEGQLAYVAGQGRSELHFRDIIASQLHVMLESSRVVVQTEWGGIVSPEFLVCRSDIAVLNKKYEPLAVVEFTVDATANFGVKGISSRTIRKLKKDAAKCVSYGPQPEVFVVLLLTHFGWASRRRHASSPLTRLAALCSFTNLNEELLDIRSRLADFAGEDANVATGVIPLGGVSGVSVELGYVALGPMPDEKLDQLERPVNKDQPRWMPLPDGSKLRRVTAGHYRLLSREGEELVDVVKVEGRLSVAWQALIPGEPRGTRHSKWPTRDLAVHMALGRRDRT
ncbi:hypothetical protein ACFV7R_13075 [Streptomyces sp. NPDC059866]|uniref:hypothetical protein n=1 Tax=Streptomyces sp. NPDC059866 TaxID=3346978 RepID=UPI00364FBDC3